MQPNLLFRGNINLSERQKKTKKSQHFIFFRMITVYVTSLCANLAIKKKCDEVVNFLSAQRVIQISDWLCG